MFSKSHLKIVTKPLVAKEPQSAATHRQELIAGFNQARLTKARALIVGGGGIGGEIAEGLCRKGIGYLCILDHDAVELSNLNRQHFFKKDLGNNKAVSLARNLAEHCHAGTILEAFALSFQDALASNIDVTTTFVVCGVDNAEARVAVSKYFRRFGIPAIFIAVDYHAESGYVFVQDALAASPCFGCAFPNSLDGRKAPCFVPSAKDILKCTGGMALYAVDSLLMERRRNWNYRLIHLAGYAPDVVETITQRSQCPLCSAM